MNNEYNLFYMIITHLKNYTINTPMNKTKIMGWSLKFEILWITQWFKWSYIKMKCKYPLKLKITKKIKYTQNYNKIIRHMRTVVEK